MKIKSENDELVIEEGTIGDKIISIEFKHHIIKIFGMASVLIAGKSLNVKIIDIKKILCDSCRKQNRLKCPTLGLDVKSVGSCSVYEPNRSDLSQYSSGIVNKTF